MNQSTRSDRPRIRPDALRATCFNTGAEVWLYDDDALPILAESGLFEALGGDANGLERLAAPLLRAGRYFGFSLEGDSAVDIEVHVGAPLSKKELAAARWLAPQKGFLDVPSGALCIESNDTLRFNPDATEPGARLQIAPGVYLVTLYRIDWPLMRRDGLADAYRGAAHVITLTGGAKAKPVRGQPALLPFEPSVRLAAHGAVTGGVFDGQVYFDSLLDGCYVGMGAAELAALDVRDGTLLELHAPEASITTHVIYTPQWPDESRGAFISRVSSLDRPKDATSSEWGYAYAMNCLAFLGTEYVFCKRVGATQVVPDALLHRWVPGRVRCVG